MNYTHSEDVRALDRLQRDLDLARRPVDSESRIFTSAEDVRRGRTEAPRPLRWRIVPMRMDEGFRTVNARGLCGVWTIRPISHNGFERWRLSLLEPRLVDERHDTIIHAMPKPMVFARRVDAVSHAAAVERWTHYEIAKGPAGEKACVQR